MALFQRKRFVWNEPWFFQQRIRTTGGWIGLVIFLLVIAGICGTAIVLATPAGQAVNWLEVVGLSVGLAAAVWWIVDGTESRRQAVLLDDSIVVGGDMGRYSRPTTYKLAAIPGAAIVMPDESKWPEPALFFHYDDEEQAIGIDSKTSLPRLAQAIHEAGIPVRLEGWMPDQESVLSRQFQWQADPAQVTKTATMETLPDDAPSLMNAGGIALAIVRQCWAIVLWLAVTGLAIYYGYQNWGNLGIVQIALLFVVPIAVMWVAGEYTSRIASASTSHGLVEMARQQVKLREGVQIEPDADDLIPVEVFDREQFDKTVQKIREMGFLQADHEGRRLLFEGKKVRWAIPIEAIRSLALEEVQTGTPGESATGTLNYYVVVNFATDEGEEEVGFRHSDRDYGDFDDVKRAQGGILVYDAIDSLLTHQLNPRPAATSAAPTEATVEG